MPGESQRGTLNRMTRQATRPLFGLAFVSFFLPFVAVSCSGVDVVAFSGLDLALGRDAGPWQGVNVADLSEVTIGSGQWWALVAAVAAIAGVLVGPGVVGALVAIGGLGALIVLRISLVPDLDPAVSALVSIDFKPGFWMALGAFGLAGIAAAMPVATGPSVTATALPEAPRLCRVCGATIAGDAAYCQSCGAAVAPPD